MSSPYPPQTPPRRLERSRNNKIVGGVCAGVARYLNMDVTLVRVLTVVLTFFTGVPVVAYIVALFVMPEEKQAPYAGPPTVHVPNGATDPVWGAAGAPWDQNRDQARSDATPPPPPPPPSPAPSPQPNPEPATAATESPVETGPVPDPEPVAETPTPEAPSGEASSWESAPADPTDAEPEASGETPPNSPPTYEGHKPSS